MHNPLALHDTSIAQACARIAPVWPLDRWIAVNPLWGFVDTPLATVSAQLSTLSGACLLMPRIWYREAWKAGRFQLHHLQQAVALSESRRTAGEIVSRLETSDRTPVTRRPQVVDLLDSTRDLVHGMSWRDFVLYNLSQFCAAYFDEGQSQLGPSKEEGLYAAWRHHAAKDRSPELLMGLHEYPALAAALPPDTHSALVTGLDALGLSPLAQAQYLTALLIDIQGWAGWCAGLGWRAAQEGKEDHSLVELLAVRVAWEEMLLRSGGQSLVEAWVKGKASWGDDHAAAHDAQEEDWLMQRALELAYQESLCRHLTVPRPLAPPPQPVVQAVFCIDVRSERFRRGLEAQSSEVQTLGFAGFFGLPLAYQAVGARLPRPQLPGLLASSLLVTDTGVPTTLSAKRTARLQLARAWKKFSTSAISCFAFVETLGLFYGYKLLLQSLGVSRPAPLPEREGLSCEEHAARKPRLTEGPDGQPLSFQARVDLAVGLLRSIGLTRQLGSLVLLIGHGSEGVNNPHAAGLACGACGGQTGEVNARAAAALLNDLSLRPQLRAEGIDLSEDTHFLPGLHNTMTDEVTLFDLEALPTQHQSLVSRLQTWLHRAGAHTRAERAPALGLAGLSDKELHDAISKRARDWAQLRPEWGLANNAAFLVAPRAASSSFSLDGRVFLHDYSWKEDPEFTLLERIMTAPMLVAHWINFQYYAATVDNLRFGSGNKLLHNVVGGHVGVFEGNTGDLRTGLSLQSLHDGTQWVHTPLRLHVFLEAPQEAIAQVLRKHEVVRHLVDNAWIHLFQTDATQGSVSAYRQGSWIDVGDSPHTSS